MFRASEVESTTQRTSLRDVWTLFGISFLEATGSALFYACLIYVVSESYFTEDSPRDWCTYWQLRAQCGGQSGKLWSRDCAEMQFMALKDFRIIDFMLKAWSTALLAPFLGTWSDVYGRKPFLLLTSLAQLLPMISVLRHLMFHQPLYTCFWMSLLCAPFRSTVALRAYIADSVPSEKKPLYYTYLFSITGAAQLLGNFALDEIFRSPSTAVTVSILASVGSLVLILRLVKESRPVAADERSVSALSLKECMRLLVQNRLFCYLTVCLMITGVAAVAGLDGSSNRLALHLPFSSCTLTCNSLSTMRVIMRASWLLAPLLLYFLAVRLHLSHTKVLIGVFGALAGLNLLHVVVRLEPRSYVVGPIGMFAIVLVATIISMESDMVAKRHQGALQGAICSAQAFVSGAAKLASRATSLVYVEDSLGLWWESVYVLIVCCFQVGGVYVECKVHNWLRRSCEEDVEDGPAAEVHPIVVENAKNFALYLKWGGITV